MMRKLKNLVLDPSRQAADDSVAARTSGRRPRRQPRQRRGDRRVGNQPQPETMHYGEDYKAAWVALAILFPVAMFILFGGSSTAKIAINPETLCPIENDQLARKTYILIDLSESLSKAQRLSLQNLLKATANNMQTRELLSISQMQAVQNNPRQEVQRFCSPDIQRIGQLGSRISRGDCPDIISNGGDEFTWPRNVGEATRDDIRAACDKYLRREKKVVEASDRYQSINPEQKYSYIIESIEDVMEEANDEPTNIPTRLIVFSDMLQNAGWFSQYKIKNPVEWTVENLRDRRKKETAMGTRPDHNFSEVVICYLPSAHPVLASARSKKQHRKMWRDYFSETAIIEEEDANGCAQAVENLTRQSG